MTVKDENRTNEIDKKRKKDAWGFNWCATVDIRSSKYLYEQGQYSMSIFHLQQGSEKLLKAVGLCLDLYRNANECRKSVGHDPFKVFEKYFEIVYDFIDDAFSASQSPELIELRREMIRAFRRGQKGGLMGSKAVSLWMDSKQIHKFLSIIDDAHRMTIQNADRFILDSLSKITAKPFNPTEEEKRKTIIYLKKNFIITNLLLIAYLLKFHEETTRYPNDTIQPWEYDPQLGVLSHIHDLWYQLDRIKEYAEEMYPFLKDNN